MSFAPDKYKFTCKQGKTFRRRLTIKRNGVVLNLTGYSARMQVRPKASSKTVYVDLTVENGGIVMGGAAGTIDIVISKTVMAKVPFGVHQYEIEVMEPSGEVPDYLTLSGPFNVPAEVIR